MGGVVEGRGSVLVEEGDLDGIEDFGRRLRAACNEGFHAGIAV